MTSRLEKHLQSTLKKGAKALIPYIMAGDPDPETTIQIAMSLVKSGADVIELGLPFSDPIADGPAIQKAGCRALAGGVTTKIVLEIAKEIRKQTGIPLVLMTYYNPVLHYGLEEFANRAKECGVDGLIVPDLPLEESKPLKGALSQAGIALVPLIAPNSGEERIAAICGSAEGFIYCVSVTGITGERKSIKTDLGRFTSLVRKYTGLPVAVGFGISGPESAAAVSPYCDAVVVGSRLVNLIEMHAGREDLPAIVGREAAAIKVALKQTGGEYSAAL